jgi:hypothetical protein
MIAETVVVAIIMGGFGLGGQVIISGRASKTHAAVTDVKLEAIKAEIGTMKEDVKLDISGLTQDVKKHNDFMGRIAVLESKDKNILAALNEIKENCKDNRRNCAFLAGREEIGK